jgi:hypothetical protein
MQTNRRTHQIEMKNPTTSAIGMLSAAALLIPPLPARSQAPSAQDYLIRTVDPVAEHRDIQYTFVNNSGVIVEQYISPVGAPFPEGLHLAVLQGGIWSEINVPGAVGPVPPA